jgi:hypothetical protein
MPKNPSNSINGYLTNGILFNAKLMKSYESRSLGGDVTEANRLFSEFQTKMGKIFEKEGLLELDFLKVIF